MAKRRGPRAATINTSRGEIIAAAVKVVTAKDKNTGEALSQAFRRLPDGPAVLFHPESPAMLPLDGAAQTISRKLLMVKD